MPLQIEKQKNKYKMKRNSDIMSASEETCL